MKRKNYQLLEALSEKRMTQVELARKAGVSSESRLSRIIRYTTLPKEEEIIGITKVLGESSEFLGLKGEQGE